MPAPNVSVTIFVVGTKRGNPGIIVWPDRIRTRRNKHVFWGVLNTHSQDVKVSVNGFARVSRASSANPVDFSQGKKTAVIPANGIGFLKGRVKKNADLGLYAYKIYIDKRLAQDPELEIEG